MIKGNIDVEELKHLYFTNFEGKKMNSLGPRFEPNLELGRVEIPAEGKTQVNLGIIKSANGERVFNVKMLMTQAELTKYNSGQISEAVNQCLENVGNAIGTTLNEIEGTAGMNLADKTFSIGSQKNEEITRIVEGHLTSISQAFSGGDISGQEKLSLQDRNDEMMEQILQSKPQSFGKESDLSSLRVKTSSSQASSVQRLVNPKMMKTQKGAGGKINFGTKAKEFFIRNPFRFSDKNVKAFSQIGLGEKGFDPAKCIQGAMKECAPKVQKHLERGLFLNVDEPKANRKGMENFQEDINSQINMANEMAGGKGSELFVESLRKGFKSGMEKEMKEIQRNLSEIRQMPGMKKTWRGRAWASFKGLFRSPSVKSNDISTLRREVKKRKKAYINNVMMTAIKANMGVVEQKFPGIKERLKSEDFDDLEEDVQKDLFKMLPFDESQQNIIGRMNTSLDKLKDMKGLSKSLEGKIQPREVLGSAVQEACTQHREHARGVAVKCISHFEIKASRKSSAFLRSLEGKTMGGQVEKYREEFADLRGLENSEQIEKQGFGDAFAQFVISKHKKGGKALEGDILSGLKARFSGVGASIKRRRKTLAQAAKNEARIKTMYETVGVPQRSVKKFGGFFGLTPGQMIKVLKDEENPDMQIDKDRFSGQILRQHTTAESADWGGAVETQQRLEEEFAKTRDEFSTLLLDVGAELEFSDLMKAEGPPQDQFQLKEMKDTARATAFRNIIDNVNQDSGKMNKAAKKYLDEVRDMSDDFRDFPEDHWGEQSIPGRGYALKNALKENREEMEHLGIPLPVNLTSKKGRDMPGVFKDLIENCYSQNSEYLEQRIRLDEERKAGYQEIEDLETEYSDSEFSETTPYLAESPLQMQHFYKHKLLSQDMDMENLSETSSFFEEESMTFNPGKFKH